jgi:hypothetical protein
MMLPKVTTPAKMYDLVLLAVYKNNAVKPSFFGPNDMNYAPNFVQSVLENLTR